MKEGYQEHIASRKKVSNNKDNINTYKKISNKPYFGKVDAKYKNKKEQFIFGEIGFSNTKQEQIMK